MSTQPPAQAGDEPMPVPFPPMPLAVVKHALLGSLFDFFAMQQYALRYADLVVAATPRATADVEQLRTALNDLIAVAERCDSWESFPADALEAARSATKP